MNTSTTERNELLDDLPYKECPAEYAISGFMKNVGEWAQLASFLSEETAIEAMYAIIDTKVGWYITPTMAINVEEFVAFRITTVYRVQYATGGTVTGRRTSAHPPYQELPKGDDHGCD